MSERGRKLPRVWGISRMADNAKAILVSFVEPLTDDQLRAFHDSLRAAPAAAVVPREVTCPHCGMPFEVEP
jgi:acetone carboxylase gamma subunit